MGRARLRTRTPSARTPSHATKWTPQLAESLTVTSRTVTFSHSTKITSSGRKYDLRSPAGSALHLATKRRDRILPRHARKRRTLPVNRALPGQRDIARAVRVDQAVLQMALPRITTAIQAVVSSIDAPQKRRGGGQMQCHVILEAQRADTVRSRRNDDRPTPRRRARIDSSLDRCRIQRRAVARRTETRAPKPTKPSSADP